MREVRMSPCHNVACARPEAVLALGTVCTSLHFLVVYSIWANKIVCKRSRVGNGGEGSRNGVKCDCEERIQERRKGERKGGRKIQN